VRTARIVAWTAVALAFGWITVSALWPRTSPPPVDLGMSDKLQHLLVWLGLGLVSWPAWRVTLRGKDGGLAPRRARASWCFLVLVAYGAAIEGLQSFVPGRSMEALDLVADAVGAALACAGAIAWEVRRERLASQVHVGMDDGP